jgi:adenylate kinase family enzyme
VKYYTAKGQLFEVNGEQRVEAVTAQALSAIENGNRS